MFKKIIMLAALMALVAGCETGTKNTTKAGKAVCKVDSDCSDGNLCVDNYCAESAATCNHNFDCATNENCESGVCVSINEPVTEDECTTDDDCTSGYTCDTSASPKKCVFNAIEETECESDSDCTVEGQTCQDNVCAYEEGLCATDSDCDAGYTCSSGACVSQGGGGKNVTDDTPTFSKIDETITCLNDEAVKIIATNTTIEAFTWRVSGLPADEFSIDTSKPKSLTIKRAAGKCSTEDKVYNFSVTAVSTADSSRNFVSDYSFTVAKVEPLVIDATECVSFESELTSTCIFKATGGSGTYTWSISNDSLQEFTACDPASITASCKVTGKSLKTHGATEQLTVVATDPITEQTTTKTIEVKVSQKLFIYGSLYTNDGNFTVQHLNSEENNTISGYNVKHLIDLRVPGDILSNADTEWSITSEQSKLITLKTFDGNNSVVKILASTSYDGEALAFTVTAKSVRGEATLNFSDITFNSIPCEAPELVTDIKQQLVPGKTYKKGTITLPGSAITQGWKIKSISSNVLTFKKDTDAIRSLILTPNSPVPEVKLGDYKARTEFTGIIQPKIEAVLVNETCNSEETKSINNISIVYPDFEKETLRGIVISFGHITDANKNSNVNATLYKKDGTPLAQSDEIPLDEGAADDITSFFGWKKCTNTEAGNCRLEAGDYKYLRDLKIKASDVAYVRYRFYDCDGCASDIDIHVLKAWIFTRNYFAIANNETGAGFEVGGTKAHRNACLIPSSDISAAINCDEEYTFEKSWKYQNSEDQTNAQEDTSWFYRQNIVYENDSASGYIPWSEKFFDGNMVATTYSYKQNVSDKDRYETGAFDSLEIIASMGGGLSAGVAIGCFAGPVGCAVGAIGGAIGGSVGALVGEGIEAFGDWTGWW